MKRNPVSLARALWLIGVALLILGAGVGFIGYWMWEKKAEVSGDVSQASQFPTECWLAVRPNQKLELDFEIELPVLSADAH